VRHINNQHANIVANCELSSFQNLVSTVLISRASLTVKYSVKEIHGNSAIQMLFESHRAVVCL